ncbi:MAG: FtsQ-type POTRA domain-containing protein [Nitrospinota bacterium]|nr:FtsQ-type POTRA domain-containing protein [Nitrospinota bacterium]
MSKSKTWKWIVGLGALGVVVTMGWPTMAARAGIGQDAAMEYFILREIHLDGLVSVPEKEVTDLLSLRSGTSIFNVDLEEAGRRLEGHPLVESVEIRRQIPSTLYVKVTERTPQFALKTSKKLWLVDKTGVAISEAEKNSDTGGFAVITEQKTDGIKITPGMKLTVNDLQYLVAAAYRLKDYRLFGKHEFAGLGSFDKQRVAARFEGTDIVVTALKKGWTDEMERLLTVDYILRGKESGIVAIDLSFPNKVVVMHAKSDAEKMGVN